MRYTFGLVALYLLTCANQMVAQSVVDIRLSAVNDGTQQLIELVESFDQSCTFRLHQQIAELENVCGLSDSQRRKLEVASKGVVAKLVKQEENRHQQKLREYQGHAGFEFDEDGKTIEPEETKEILGIQLLIQTSSPRKIDESKVWKKAIRQVLTETQLEKVEARQSEREKRQQQIALDYFLTQADSLLYLTAEQKTRLKPIVEEKVGKLLLKHFQIADLIRYQTLIRRENLNKETGWRKLLEGVLTPRQIDEWESSIEPKLFQMETDVMTVGR